MFSFHTLIGTLAILFTVASASPASSAPDFELTHLTTYSPNGQGNASDSDDANYHLSFVVRNPDVLANSSALCTGQWKLNGSYPTESYVSCSNSSFGWNFDAGSFKNIYTFTLQVKNTFVDPAVGDYPYNHVTNFAKVGISRNETTCASVRKGAHQGDYSCHQKDNTTISAPIWATIA